MVLDTVGYIFLHAGDQLIVHTKSMIMSIVTDSKQQ